MVAICLQISLISVLFIFQISNTVRLQIIQSNYVDNSTKLLIHKSYNEFYSSESKTKISFSCHHLFFNYKVIKIKKCRNIY